MARWRRSTGDGQQNTQIRYVQNTRRGVMKLRRAEWPRHYLARESFPQHLFFPLIHSGLYRFKKILNEVIPSFILYLTR